jgi:hypothetical protein
MRKPRLNIAACPAVLSTSIVTRLLSKIRGFRLDGKVLYRRDDLDEFIRLYEIRSKIS